MLIILTLLQIKKQVLSILPIYLTPLLQQPIKTDIYTLQYKVLAW